MDNIGSTLGGRRLEPKFCHFEGLIHMATGSLVSIYVSMLKYEVLQLLYLIISFDLIFLAGMASLYTTVALSIVRLHIINGKDRSWLEHSSLSLRSSRYLLFIWILAFTFAAPPLIGIGIYDQSMVGAR